MGITELAAPVSADGKFVHPMPAIFIKCEDELELKFTQGGRGISYKILTDSQSHEEQPNRLRQKCCVCLRDIGIHSVDCSVNVNMRKAIELLYNLEIKPEDEYSRLVCQKCVEVVEHIMFYQRGVKDAQEKIERNAEKQIDVSPVAVKVEAQIDKIDGPCVPQPIEMNGDAHVPENHTTDPIQQSGADESENECSERSGENGDMDQNRTKNADTERAPKLRIKVRNAASGRVATSTASTSNTTSTPLEGTEAINQKKRRRTNEGAEQTDENSSIKRCRTFWRNLHSYADSVHTAHVVSTSIPSAVSHNQSSAQKLKLPVSISKPKRQRRQTETLPSTSGQGTILKYLSKPSCSKCNVALKTISESHFHDKCHAKKRCSVCKQTVRTNEVKKHVYTCLLMSGKLSTNEMLLYMTPVSIQLDSSKTIKMENMSTHRTERLVKRGEAPPCLTDVSTEDEHPIYVMLIRRHDNFLELTMTHGGPELMYETLSESQRQAVQKCLLANDIWKQMLHHIENGSSFTPRTLMAFRHLLPPAERQHFFSIYSAAKGLPHSNE